MARKSGGTRTALATIIILASLVIAMVVPQGQAVASSVGLTSNEAQMLALVNQARAEAGLAPLYAEQRLTDMARNYSSEMIQYDFFSHTSPVSGSFSTRVAAQGFTGYTVAGENIAKSPTVASAFAAFMNSEGHRANILRANYNCVGIGILDGPNGLVVTQEFMAFSQIPDTADVSGSSNPTTTPVTAASSSSFDTYYLVMNPNDTAARIDVIFQDDDGSRHTYSYTVAAHSRYTVPARETLGGTGSFNATIESSIPVLAERAMYFSSEGRAGGHDSIGASKTSTTWYFAEGYTGGTFDTWVLVMNPNSSAVTATLNFMKDDGSVVANQVNIPAGGRQSVHVDTVPGLENANVSTQVVCDLPVVAERSMYFDYNGKSGGHNSIGVTDPSSSWYFAEGYTGGELRHLGAAAEPQLHRGDRHSLLHDGQRHFPSLQGQHPGQGPLHR